MKAAEVWTHIKIGLPNDCWPWLGAHDSNGYGCLEINGKLTRAHRVVWELTHKRKVGKFKVRHTCDNKPCCNPRHLRRGTQKQNMHDAVVRGHMGGSRSGWAKHPELIPRGSLQSNAKLTEAKVRWARRMHSTLGTNKLAKLFKVSPGTMSTAVHGKTWSHI